MAENYLANTPLIITADDGTPFRVERGEVVELTDAQYEQVAAHVTHVTVVDQDAEDEDAATPSHLDEQAETQVQPEAETQAQTQAQPGKSKRDKKAAE